MLNDYRLQHEPGILGRDIPFTFESFVIKLGELFQGNFLEKITHRLILFNFASKGILNSEIESCLRLCVVL